MLGVVLAWLGRKKGFPLAIVLGGLYISSLVWDRQSKLGQGVAGHPTLLGTCASCKSHARLPIKHEQPLRFEGDACP